MNSPNQEPLNPNNECYPEEQLEESVENHSLLRRDSFNSSSSPPATNHHHTSCASCGCPRTSSSTKRRPIASVPLPSMDEDEHHLHKKPKKLFADPRETNTNSGDNPDSTPPFLRGFTMIPLPMNIQFPGGTSSPILRRCVSDPTRPPVPPLSPESPPPEMMTPLSKTGGPLPPRPPLRRAVSDLSPSRGFSRSSSSKGMVLDDNGSVKFQVLKKIKDCVEEMSLCCNELIKDGEGDKDSEDDAIYASEPKEQNDSRNDNVEAVRVEKTGECMTIQFTCPCGKGYQTLLKEGNCYYKLV
ncbi:hypothetical protein Tsubulata_025387 [Turnera subulata]|uniref:Uncharacterized protein n=1 Tax=Turnera subulata TaxID=218843 RepID=A0A9Q0FFD1_9ROSI|nr:hypothetical protein Tsubulata_025387 [Turnera subulata]